MNDWDGGNKDEIVTDSKKNWRWVEMEGQRSPGSFLVDEDCTSWILLRNNLGHSVVGRMKKIWTNWWESSAMPQVASWHRGRDFVSSIWCVCFGTRFSLVFLSDSIVAPSWDVRKRKGIELFWIYSPKRLIVRRWTRSVLVEVCRHRHRRHRSS